tara:strand:+ start:1720 stop:1932 length:213 start_codon:yes stop_codon:yes gene_type:complete
VKTISDNPRYSKPFKVLLCYEVMEDVVVKAADEKEARLIAEGRLRRRKHLKLDNVNFGDCDVLEVVAVND